MVGELNQEQIWNLLASEVVGRIGCCHDNQVYVVPVTYASDRDNIYVYTKEGLKVQMMRRNPQVCFEVDRVDNMANWQSIIIWGKYQELNGQEARDALQMLTNRVVPLVTSETIRPHFGLDRGHGIADSKMKMVIFKISIERSTGKYEKSK